MKRHRLTIVALVVMTVAGGTALAQEPKPAPEPAPQPVAVRPPRPSPAIPLEVQVVISRHQGEKRVSSLPYTLAVNSDNVNSQLNVGANIPVPVTTFAPAGGGDGKPPLTSWSYQNVGTNIDCRVTTTEDGRFDLTVSVDESSVVTSADGTSGSVAGVSVMRTFKSRNRLLLRDGQTRQYTAATDRVNGETIRIEVTLRVVK